MSESLYVINNGVLVSYKGREEEPQIPEGVTEIYSCCFFQNEYIKRISIPDTVTIIGGHAFKSCKNLESVSMGRALKEIGCSAFEGCFSLKELKLSEGLELIGENAFKYCVCLEELSIPEGVKVLGHRLFDGCKRLKRVSLPATIESLGCETFRYCTALEELSCQGKLPPLVYDDFTGCADFVEKHSRDGLFILDSRLIGHKGEPETVNIPQGVKCIAENCFRFHKKLKRVSFPRGLESIEANAFGACEGLSEINLPDSLEKLGRGSFSGCGGLKKISLPDSLKEIPQAAFSCCSKLKSVKLPEKLEVIGHHAFSGCHALISPELPGSLSSIQEGAFENCAAMEEMRLPENIREISEDLFKGCSGLKKLELPGSLTVVGRSAFSGCSSLESLIFPDTLEKLGSEAFSGCSSLQEIRLPSGCRELELKDIEGCDKYFEKHNEDGILYSGTTAIKCFSQTEKAVIRPGTEAIGPRAFFECEKLKELVVTEGVEHIGFLAFFGCSALERLSLPQSLKSAEDMALGSSRRLQHLELKGDFMLEEKMFKAYIYSSVSVFPDVLFKELSQLREHMSPGFIGKLLEDERAEELPWQLVTELFMSHQSAKLSKLAEKLIKDPNAAAEYILSTLSPESSSKYCGNAVKFLEIFCGRLKNEIVADIYRRLKELKAGKKAAQKLENNTELLKKLSAAGIGGPEEEKLKHMSEAEKRLSELLDAEGSSEMKLKEKFTDLYSKIPLPELKDKNGAKLPDSVLLWLFTAHDNVSYDYNNAVEPECAYNKPGIRPEAEKLLELVDEKSFKEALRRLSRENLGLSGKSKKMYLALPICRYADEELMEELTKKAPSWRSSVSGNNAPPLRTFRLANIASSTRAAMLFADKYGDLWAYARLRDTDPDTIRDVYLSDVGIDEKGSKSYELGNQTVTAQLQPDLSFLVLCENGKTVKSLPKKGADEEKYAAANADFSEMKKAVKKIVKNRSKVLFEDFLHSHTRKSEDWERAYMHNPLLSSVARLIVWKQRRDCFTVSDAGLIRADGSEYTLQPGPVSLAHPMKMDQSEIRAWQRYFTSRGLKQPFLQIWEPVINPATVRPDRYKGMMIPYYRFRDQDKHGIHVQDWDFHNEIYISFDDCTADVERIDYSRHEIFNSDRFEIKSISFDKYTPMVNHIIAHFDHATVYEQILKDNVEALSQVIDSFTLAQITEFLSTAAENNCPNVTAALLDYKNKHFADFDPMEEFSLE